METTPSRIGINFSAPNIFRAFLSSILRRDLLDMIFVQQHTQHKTTYKKYNLATQNKSERTNSYIINQSIMSQQQEDGYYPRLNSNMLLSGTYNQQIISLIGRMQSNDGSILALQCADGGKAQVQIDPDFSARGPVIEIVGLVNDNGTVQVK